MNIEENKQLLLNYTVLKMYVGCGWILYFHKI